MELINEGKKLALSGIKRILGIIVLFTGTNVIMVIYCSYMLLSNDVSIFKIFSSVLAAVIFIAFAGYKAYQFALIETIKVIYQKYSSSSLRKVCSAIIDKSEKIFKF